MKRRLMYTKADVDRAGDVLSGNTSQKMTRDMAIKVLENFRSIHIHPLNMFRMSLQRKSLSVSKDSLISQRLKRAPSIVNKLKIQKNMSLSQMQDVGGLRVVMKDLKEVYKVRGLIRNSENQPAFKSTLQRETDYIVQPKESGYRSIHLIYKYNKNVDQDSQCKIEIQLRTKVQHAWATAVEIIGTYLRQPLKQSFGDQSLLNLFKEISKGFVLIENRESNKELFVKLDKQIEEVQLRDLLQGFSMATKITTDNIKRERGKYFLITLNFKSKTLHIDRFPESKLDNANSEYSNLEKKYLNDPSVEIVLVSVNDINNLSKLYPNYFLDTQDFIGYLDMIHHNTT